MTRKLEIGDEVVKQVFDHLRNVGIAGAVFAAGVWSFNHPVAGALGLVGKCSAIALCLLGLSLFVIAVLHGVKKLDHAQLHLRWEIVAVGVYSLTVIAFFATTALRIELH